ncbi:MAG: methyl-accepting chemotaxis protein [Hydrogenophaga sp.]|jgi:methyl-accepting chemotaxis protein|uniref:methyl-accepting chemotaxis protein n=1 Tax=Hydrogenophaga sp. TaxID=1904254 RepID=UPI001D7B089A|nr:methyl-accepting chemotaxis protein [Hydrogenophaga sp.]MBW0169910.1 MCP four helix bundle domain-containing protein [Hydrogenophaga sp.]MBW0183049.1 MCP four helix bundle domain-containing protein [Hydrogenophaga sp.]
MLKNIKISTRLAGTLALLLATMVATVAIALLQMGSMRADTQTITDNWLPSVELVNQMNTQSSDFRAEEFHHVVATDAQSMDRIEKSMASSLAAFDKEHKGYVALISSDEEQRLHDAFQSEWKKYLEVHDRMLALSRANENEKARALLEGESQTAFDNASAGLVKLVQLNSQGAHDAATSAEQSYLHARNTLAVALVVAVAVAVAAGMWLMRSITAPLNQALAVAERVAQGDLTSSIAIHSSDEIGQVLQALQRMQDSLVKVVSTVRMGSESVSTASVQISEGNHDLSARTESQASALEQTAASMEELSSTVRQNADNAAQANQLAQSASSVAVEGGQVVSQVVDTMRGINESSRKIADIINVIDGIAFQTNILALNAAVEAARAGEQGRGFAVVAGEVRNLAQRSAQAAKEIKQLINDSVDRVEIGNALVDKAGATMHQLVDSVRRVTDIMGEISAASKEQSDGVSQIGEAVTQMDQVTQQNAALVEEMSAAASSLKTQASDLVQTVSVFRISGHTQQATPRTYSPPAAPPARTVAAKPVTPPAPGTAPRKAAPQAASRPAKPAPARTEVAIAGGSDDWESF